MIANTYVVKPFGISEVKVIALKGEPGGPTQEQVNTAVEEYMDDHPEAQIPDGAVTTEKLASNAVAPYADNLVSSSYVSDSEPYLFRKTFAGVREDTEIVGGSLVWNQLLQPLNSNDWRAESGVTATYTDGVATVSSTTANNGIYQLSYFNVQLHKYLITFEANGASDLTIGLSVSGAQGMGVSGVGAGAWTRYSAVVNCTGGAGSRRTYLLARGSAYDNVMFRNAMIIDLTLMFGPTIADYIYTQEQATAGAGVAFFRSLFSKPYYAYNAGTLKSVEGLTAHKMTGFNQWDEEWEEGGLNNGVPVSVTNRIRSKNFCPILPNTTYFGTCGETDGGNQNVYYISVHFYDSDKVFISSLWTNNKTFTTPSNAAYFKITTNSSTVVYGGTYNNDICINISDPQRNGTYEPYTSVTYPLSPVDLRGIPTIVDGKLKYDGDIRKSDGTVERRYGYRAYQSGDESLANAITDGTHTVYKLTTASTETTDSFTNPQVCYPDGTEEYIDTREVPIPVGHNTKYMRDLKKLLEGIPDAPTANGTYVIKATVSSSGVTYAWIAG